MCHGIIRHKQAVGIFVLLCILLGGYHLRHELVGIHCPGIGKGNIVHCFVRQSVIRRAGDAHAGEVKPIGVAGRESKLLIKLRRQPGYIRRNVIARFVELAVAAKPHKGAAGISVGTGQTIGGRRGKALTVFYDDLNILGAVTQLAAAKIKGNGFQSVRVQRAKVQDFKDGAETDVRAVNRSIAAAPVADRIMPTKRTSSTHNIRSILPPRRHPTPVFDISVILVQYPVPFVALGRAAFGIA